MFEYERESPKPLKVLLEKLIQMHGWEDKLDFNKLINTWQDFVGPVIAQHTKPVKLIEGILHIKTDSSVWRSELLIRHDDIVNLINTKLSKNVVISLKIR